MAVLTRAASRAIAASMMLLLILASPLSVSAHVNRVVGPYTFFVVLIEEPFFATNRAGFEFWVHDGDRPVQGLDLTLKAQAISTSRTVDLLVSPINNRGFYDVEAQPDGGAFDPGSGGKWTLRLTGTVEGRSVDESFATVFPAYPRVAAVSPKPTIVAADTGPGLQAFMAIGGVLAGFAGVLGLALRNRRRVAGPSRSAA